MGKNQKIVLYLLAGILLIAVIALVAVKVRIRIAGETTVRTYFLKYDEPQKKNYLVPVSRQIERTKGPEEKIRAALEALLKGISEEEKEKGLINSVNEKAVLLGVRIEDDTAYLDFSKEIEEGGGTSMMTERLGQIVFTATQFPPVAKVRILINGEFIKYFSGEGITDVESPMGRENFSFLAE
ncbi:MAG: GerMN domain-containing protein [Candidatus Omnitrophica bacterium]|nr:GerMN domain-containing protein [Candidatus Omnitrophota bacterium]